MAVFARNDQLASGALIAAHAIGVRRDQCAAIESTHYGYEDWEGENAV